MEIIKLTNSTEKPPRLNFIKAFLIVCVSIIIQIAAIEIIKNWENAYENLRAVIVGIAIPIAGILSTLVVTYFYKINIRSFYLTSTFFKSLIPGFILLFGINVITSTLLVEHLDFERYFENFNNLPAWALVIGVILIIPICEEIIHRGIILKYLLNSYQSHIAVVYSSLLFAITHSNLIQFVSAFFAGLGFGWIFIKTRSLSLCIVIHCLNNLVALYLIKNPEYSVETNIGDGYDPRGMIIGSIMILLGVIFFINSKYEGKEEKS